MKGKSSATTLIELILYVILVSVIVLALSNIDIFSRHNVISSDRRAKLQNEVSFVLDHVAKNINRAIGNLLLDGYDNPTIKTDVVDNKSISGQKALKISVDVDNNGKKDSPHQLRVAYILTPFPSRELLYYPQYNEDSPQGGEVLSRRVVDFNTAIVKDASGEAINVERVRITACWEPATAVLPNGTPDNPCVKMQARINMPSVSTH